MKKNAIILVFIFIGFCAFSQQIPRIGVVDTSRVFQTYFRDSVAVRNYENKKAEFQNEINKKTEELKQLLQQKIQYEENENFVAALRLEAEITKKTDYLSSYTQAKQIELDSIRNRLENSDSFYKSLYELIGQIAESEGYSLILSLQQAQNILWYSPSVDITDKIITQLAKKQ
ncbi:MAG: OmpH family outer membrane protein [Spirochaetota bacterium]|jgi:outer membrane protein|nr:OmpH family outer membrane protein [Spirochaetota bacterium]NMA56393.1 OmpH family outer membrane protein [Treponema sp.]HPY53333.1 OmpH family outer membrane protein [Treponemataceae bacterium]HQC27374.1 OmpH family outer membrane protein [Treponemataceae bacterium]